MWQCGGCGYVWDGNEAPDNCPKCGSPKDQFTQIDEERTKLISRSRKTNCLHMHLNSLLCEVKKVADQGIEDNLDPGCMTVFTKAKEDAEQLQQCVKAEIETHVKKGKWG